jgi:hypothetical protein
MTATRLLVLALGSAQALHTRSVPGRAAPVRLQFGSLPTRLAPKLEAPNVVVTGKTTGNLVFGKLQRAAQLPGARLGTTPFASVDDRGSLSSMLWSSFAMASVASGCWLDRKDIVNTYALEGALLFVDATTAAPSGGFNPLGLFGPKDTGAAPSLDVELLQFAAARGATHVYVMMDGDDQAVAQAAAACQDAISGLTAADGTPIAVRLAATILAPVTGCTLASSPNWIADTTAQVWPTARRHTPPVHATSHRPPRTIHYPLSTTRKASADERHPQSLARPSYDRLT